MTAPTNDELLDQLVDTLLGKRVRLTVIEQGTQITGVARRFDNGFFLVESETIDQYAPFGKVVVEAYTNDCHLLGSGEVSPISQDLWALKLGHPLSLSQTPLKLTVLKSRIKGDIRTPRGSCGQISITAAGSSGLAYESSEPIPASQPLDLYLIEEGREIKLGGSVIAQRERGKHIFGTFKFGELERLPSIYWGKILKTG